MAERRLAAIDVKPGGLMESQSGLQMLRPRIYGAYEMPEAGTRTAAIVMHPTSNFMGHYLIGPLAGRGIACLGLNSRYAGNDTVLLMERVIQDLGAGVRFARETLGCRRVVLVGNSGGAALAAFYQAEAEHLVAETFVDGDPTHLVPADLPPVDGIALCAAHEGRSHLFGRWLDPSVADEHDALAVDPALDMYDPSHWTGGADAPPRFSTAFLRRFVAGQQRRRDAIERRVRERLAQLRGTKGAPRDESFVVHRTHADPRFLDLTLDANDRARGSVWGDARTVNYAANAMGRTTSLTAFLSQWSTASRAGGPENLARTSVPALLLTYTADQSTFPSTRDAWLAAGGERIRNVDIVGGDHYLSGRADLQAQVADEIAAFVESL
ncbi:MAG TPA: alpha/beta hydrolase [Caldimonas sp.]|jgi:pimeloyl-ACP methyl ester carboxylesterase|nr:alpha/beta hydrolase [Caldimonas sp.]HEX2543154.1 alpha/beta hydrolase [Caldimonas sp.]